MTGTELGRLLAEVTEQPPVDVDLSAVASKVKRHRSRVRGAAVIGSVVVVAAIVAIPVLGRSRGATVAASPSPTPARSLTVVPDASWGHDHWYSVSWRTPPGWLRSAAFPDHPRPSNAAIEGPYIGTARLPVTGPTPRPLQGNGVLGSAGPTLAPNAVVAWFTYGARDASVFQRDFAEMPVYLKAQCSKMGAPYLFHQARQFGSPTHGSNLSLDGCISAANPDQFRAQLGAILASATDTAYYSGRPTLGALRARATLAGPTTAEAVCQAALGKFATATLTTVGEIRTATWGPLVPDGKGGSKGRLANAFPGANASDVGAWCWTGRSGDYTGYAVHVGDKPAKAIEIIGPSATAPSGPPEVP